ncbi:MAG TPA: glycosyltransferase 87 family protein [Thermoplasmata archaeon]|nr:glycosyltransferase 87 family protein [Thermoplasmata archaeon]
MSAAEAPQPSPGWRRRWARLQRIGSAVLHAPDRVAGLGPVRRARDRIAALPDRRWFLFVLGIGLGIRVLLGPFTAQTDLDTFAESSTSLAYGGSLYTYLIVYPPGWLYILNLLGRLVQVFVPANGIIVVDPNLLRLTMFYGNIFPTTLSVTPYALMEKSLLWSFDLLMSFLLYQIVLEWSGSVRGARMAFALWFLNPLVITATAVHGAYDGIPSFFLLAGIYLLLHRYPLSSGAAIGAGIGLKLFPIVILPLVALILYRQGHRKLGALARSGGAWLLGAGGILAVLYWPPNIVRNSISAVATGPGVGQSFGGFWIYSVTSLPGAAGPRSWLYYNAFLISTVAIIAVVAAVVTVAFLLRRRLGAADSFGPPVAYAAFLMLVASYTVPTITQAQYLLWTLPWLILVAAMDGRLLPTILWISSLTLVFYYLGLEGPYYLLLPAAQFAHWISYSTVLASVASWQSEITWIRTTVTIAVFVVLVYAAIRSVWELTLSRRAALA